MTGKNEKGDWVTSESVVGKGEPNPDTDPTRNYIEAKTAAIKGLAEYREQIDRAADGEDYLPEPKVLRAICAYVSGEFVIYLDGIAAAQAQAAQRARVIATGGEAPLAPLKLDDDRTPEQLVADGDAPCDVCRGYPAAGVDADPGCPRCGGKGQLTVEQVAEVRARKAQAAEAERRAEAELRLMPDEVLLRRFQTEGYAELQKRVDGFTFAAVPHAVAFWALQFLIVGLGTQGARGANAAMVRTFAENVLAPMTCTTPLLRELTRRGWARVNTVHPPLKIARPGE